MADLTYTSLHWGTRPTRVDDMFFVVDDDAEPVGELAAVSYVTDKGGDPTVFRHEFSRHPDPATGQSRGPYLLQVRSGGSIRIGSGPSQMAAIGQAIDFELVDGRRIFVSDGWLATGKSGKHVYLCFPEKIPLAIEERSDGPFVTDHGIEE